jgi:hypothetical protein
MVHKAQQLLQPRQGPHYLTYAEKRPALGVGCKLCWLLSMLFAGDLNKDFSGFQKRNCISQLVCEDFL